MSDQVEELHNHIDLLEKEIEELNGEIGAADEAQVVLKDALSEAETEVKQLKDEKEELRKQSEALSAHLAAQKNSFALASRQSEEAQQNQKALRKTISQLESENSNLRLVVHELEENEDIVLSELDTLVDEKAFHQAKAEEYEAKYDKSIAEVGERAQESAIHSAKAAKAKEDLDSERIEWSAKESEWKQTDSANKAEIARLLTALEEERAKRNETLCARENSRLKTELANEKRAHGRLKSLYSQAVDDRASAERDVDSAVDALHSTRRGVKETIASVVREGNASRATVDRELTLSRKRETSLRCRCQDLDHQLDDVRDQLLHSEARNAAYERDHGLTETVRHQKKLEADLRRGQYDFQRLKSQMADECETKRVLAKALGRLKDVAANDLDFDYSDAKAALEREDNTLKGENRELRRQIDSLEDERNKLLALLRDRAIDIGKKGITFLGMTSDQMNQVIEFANHLKSGSAELPLDDKSREFLHELNTVKAEARLDKIKIATLERELFALGTEKIPSVSADNVFHQAIRKVASENQKLREELSAMKGKHSPPNSEQRERINESQLLRLVEKVRVLECELASQTTNQDVAPEPSKYERRPATAAHVSRACQVALDAQPDGERLTGDASPRHAISNVCADDSLHSKRGAHQEALRAERPKNKAVDSGKHQDFSEYKVFLAAIRTKLSEYLVDLERLRSATQGLLRPHVGDMDKLVIQNECLESLLRQKDSIIERLAHQQRQGAPIPVREPHHDHSISTQSIDRSISRALEDIACPPKRQTSPISDVPGTANGRAITEQETTVRNLKDQLALSRQRNECLDSEVESMRNDIKVLVSRLAESEANSESLVTMMQVKNSNREGSAQKDVAALGRKLSALSRDCKSKDSKIKDLEDSLVRSKRVTSVARQAKVRSEANVKQAKEDARVAKEEAEKMATHVNVLKSEKIEAVNAKLRLVQQVRKLSKAKEEDKSKPTTNAGDSQEDLEKRVESLSNTISSLASQNSNLRGALASAKSRLKQSQEDRAEQARQLARPTSSRSNKSLESKINELQHALAEETRHAEAYQQKVRSLETSLASTSTRLAEKPRELTERIKCLSEENEGLRKQMVGLEELKSQNKGLRQENRNERLSRVGNLDLFEEIEDLKLKYNEAVSLINQLTTD